MKKILFGYAAWFIAVLPFWVYFYQKIECMDLGSNLLGFSFFCGMIIPTTFGAIAETVDIMTNCRMGDWFWKKMSMTS
jgi:hypothetical protein